MKVAITGANGFIASYLLNYLPPKSILLFSRQTPLESLRSFQPTHVFHLAGQSKVSEDISRESYFQDNFLSTSLLLEGLKGNKNLQFLFFSSSVHVYGNQHSIVDETAATLPESFYGYTKLLAEKLLIEASLPQLVIGRFYNVIGPGQKRGYVLSDWIQKLKEQPNQLEVANLDSVRGFIDVREVAEILYSMIKKPLPNKFEIINFSRKERTLEEVLTLLLKIKNQSPKITIKKRENPFKGLKISTEKLNHFFPNDEILLAQTLGDMVEEMHN